MLKLEYYNDTIIPLSGQIFEKILNLVNDNFKEIFPKKLDKRKTHYITFTLVTDEIIRELNKEHRGIDEPTDVISLSYIDEEEFPGQDMIGEIFISFETAEKQAKKNEMEILDELKFLYVHGILHILGYKHKDEGDFQTMMNLTNQILAVQE
ncbi:rRNA maturation RNase YbeY [Patescibacteria group bacterium]